MREGATDPAPFTIAGMRIEIAAPAGVRAPIAHLLRYHAGAASGVATRARVRLELAADDGPPVCTTEREADGVRESTWTVPAASAEWSAERFYYRELFAVLARVLATADVVRLHGALLSKARLGGVLLLGDRGAGKSSASAAWVHEGGSVATDDAVLIGAGGAFFGLHRELHVDPDLAPLLLGLPGLASAREYLPGSHRLAYDWCADFPGRRTDAVASVQHVVRSRVEAGGPTVVRRLPSDDLRDLAGAAIAAERENALVAADARAAAEEALVTARGWDVAWGADVWARPGKHVGVLLDALGVAE